MFVALHGVTYKVSHARHHNEEEVGSLHEGNGRKSYTNEWSQDRVTVSDNSHPSSCTLL